MRVSSSLPFRRFLACALVIVEAGQPAASLADATGFNLDRNGLAIEGYDPVSYFQDTGPVRGNSSLEFNHAGATYRFSSRENLEKFQNDPEAYLPACGGWCAWAMLESDRVKVDPETFKIYEGKLLLFYNGFWGNTLEKWNAKAATTDEEDLFRTMQMNWEKLQTQPGRPER